MIKKTFTETTKYYDIPIVEFMDKLGITGTFYQINRKGNLTDKPANYLSLITKEIIKQ